MPGLGRRKARGAAALMLVFFSVMATICSAGEAWYGYDQFGRLIRSIDEQNRVTDYVYDAAGNLLQANTTLPDQTPTITSLTPTALRRGQSILIQAVGNNLLEAGIASSDPGLAVSDIQRIMAATATEINFRLTALATATLGSQTLTFSNAAGSVTAPITVTPALPNLSVQPMPLAVPPDSSARQITLRLSNPDTISHTLTLFVVDPTMVAATSPVSFPAGTTEVQITLTGVRAGQTQINLASATLGNSTATVYVTNEYAQMQRAYGPVVRVVVAAPAVTTPVTISPLRAPDVRVNLASATATTSNFALWAAPVNAAWGPIITGISPTSAPAGQSLTLTLQGAELQGATAVTVSPATGVNIGAPALAADGRSLTVPVSLAPDAPQTLRTVQALAGSTILPVSDPWATTFRLTAP